MRARVTMHSSPLNQPPTWSRAPTRSRQASESRRASLASLLSCIKFRATNTRGSFPGVARLFEFPDLPFKVLDLARLVGQLPLILSGLLVQSRHRYTMRSHLCHSPKKVPCRGRADTRQGTPRQATLFLASPTTSPESTHYANGLRGAPPVIAGGVLGCVISCVVCPAGAVGGAVGAPPLAWRGL